MNMPKLEPIPIETKGKSFLTRIWALLTVVRRWKLIEDWYFILPNGVRIVIPKGFTTDGSSIPKQLWFLLSPTGLLLVPGLVHDFAYSYDYLWALDERGNLYKYRERAGQKYWDDLFRDVGYAVNGMIISDTLSYYALRAFGFIAWGNARFKPVNEIYPE